MAFSLKDYDTYKTYFEALATSHNDISHFEFANEERLTKILRSQEVAKVLWCEPYEQVQLLDSHHDNTLEQYPCSLVVAGKKPELFDDQDQHYSDCETIVKDIIAKMLLDYQSDPQVLSTELSSYKFGRAEATFGSIIMYGCKLDFNFKAPAEITYNPSKWS